MKRRDFVKGFAVATAAAGTALGQQQPSSATQNSSSGKGLTTPTRESRATAMSRFHAPEIPISQPDAVAMTRPGYFTAARYAALDRLCELFMPATDDYPSAKKTGTAEFLDFYLGASPAADQAVYNNGLDKLNADSMKQFHVEFAKTDDKQADAVIRPFLKGWMSDHPPRTGHEHFVNLAHNDIREFTMNSPAWSAAAEALGERTPGVGLYWHPIDPGVKTWVTKTPVAHTAAKHKQA